MDVSNRIKNFREEKGLTIVDIATKAQMSAQEISDLEAGGGEKLKEWPVEKVAKLAEALEMNLSRLLGEPWLNYAEWALVWSALIEYSSHQKGLQMNDDMKELIEKVKTFVSSQAG